MDFLLPIWNPFIVHPLEQGLRLLATPLEGVVGPGAAGGLAIILFTIPVVRSMNEEEHRVSFNMAKMGYVTPVREVSPWPGFIGGAAVLGFGVLLLAVRRPRGE